MSPTVQIDRFEIFIGSWTIRHELLLGKAILQSHFATLLF